MLEYRTKDGDTADSIAYQRYGDRAGSVEAVLNANPGLAAKGDILPAGVLVKLPELAAKTVPAVRLWGDV